MWREGGDSSLGSYLNVVEIEAAGCSFQVDWGNLRVMHAPVRSSNKLTGQQVSLCRIISLFCHQSPMCRWGDFCEGLCRKSHISLCALDICNVEILAWPE